MFVHLLRAPTRSFAQNTGNLESWRWSSIVVALSWGNRSKCDRHFVTIYANYSEGKGTRQTFVTEKMKQQNKVTTVSNLYVFCTFFFSRKITNYMGESESLPWHLYYRGKADKRAGFRFPLYRCKYNCLGIIILKYSII